MPPPEESSDPLSGTRQLQLLPGGATAAERNTDSNVGSTPTLALVCILIQVVALLKFCG